jgi:hypothetical protein
VTSKTAGKGFKSFAASRLCALALNVFFMRLVEVSTLGLGENARRISF